MALTLLSLPVALDVISKFQEKVKKKKEGREGGRVRGTGLSFQLLLPT